MHESQLLKKPYLILYPPLSATSGCPVRLTEQCCIASGIGQGKSIKPTMVRPGKERMAPSEDDAATQMTAQDSRWLNGVNRQLQPDAAEQRVAA